MSFQPYSSLEKHKFFNSLAILLKAVEGKQTTIDLRNESFIYGTVEESDGFMNVVMKNCVFTDARGNQFPFDMFFVQARNIRYVHIPPEIPIIPAIKNQLGQLMKLRKDKEKVKPTFKTKRANLKQMEDKKIVEEFRQFKDTDGPSSSK